MKKLMFAMMAAAGIVTISYADIQSSNIVGYGTEATGSARYQGVGSFFFSMGTNTEKIDLTTITVECEGGDGYMFPWDEYIRQLDPESAGNLACYTYINKAFCDEAGVDYKMIGWYKWQKGYEWDENLAAGKDELKVTPGEVVFDVTQAFLGQFLGGCNFKFTCSGQVICETTEFETGSARYYLFHNYTPSTVYLSQIEVDCEGGDGYMFPWDEYIRQLDPESAGNLACYTYINKGFCDETGADYKMIGWYKWQKGYAWDDQIAAGNTELKIKDGSGNIQDVEMAPGFAFLGQFLGGCNFHFKFPNPVNPIAE